MMTYLEPDYKSIGFDNNKLPELSVIINEILKVCRYIYDYILDTVNFNDDTKILIWDMSNLFYADNYADPNERKKYFEEKMQFIKSMTKNAFHIFIINTITIHKKTNDMIVFQSEIYDNSFVIDTTVKSTILNKTRMPNVEIEDVMIVLCFFLLKYYIFKGSTRKIYIISGDKFDVKGTGTTIDESRKQFYTKENQTKFLHKFLFVGISPFNYPYNLLGELYRIPNFSTTKALDYYVWFYAKTKGTTYRSFENVTNIDEAIGHALNPYILNFLESNATVKNWPNRYAYVPKGKHNIIFSSNVQNNIPNVSRNYLHYENKSAYFEKYLKYDKNSEGITDPSSNISLENKYLKYDENLNSRPSSNRDAMHLYLKYKNKYLKLKKQLNI